LFFIHSANSKYSFILTQNRNFSKSDWQNEV